MDSHSPIIALIIGYNSGYRFGLNHDHNITKLTNWNDINSISFKSMHLSACGLIVQQSTDNTNTFYSMGKNNFGQCAINSPSKNIKTPAAIKYFIENNIEIKQVFTSITGYCTFWVSTDNKIYANGKNDAYELGLKNRQNQRTPTLIESFENIEIIKMCCSSGSKYKYSYALDCEGRVWTTEKFKNNWRIKQSLKEKVIHIATGGMHVLYVLESGIIWAIGENKYGQLGCPDRNKRSYKITYFHHSNIGIQKIACGWDYNLLLDGNGNIWSWGANKYFQCGLVDDNIIWKPTLIDSVIDNVATDVKCGYRHSYVCIGEEEHLLFGNNKYNECSLVDNGDDYVNIPISINDIINKKTNGKVIKDVFVGNDNTVVLVEDNGEENNNLYGLVDDDEEKKDSYVTLNGFLNEKRGNRKNEIDNVSLEYSDSGSESDEDIPPGVTKGNYMKKKQLEQKNNNLNDEKGWKLTPQSKQLLEDELNRKLKLNKQLQSELNMKSEKYNILENEYNSIKKELKLKDDENTEKYEALNNNLEKLNNKCEELNNYCNELKKKYKQTNEKYETLENRYNMLENKYANTNEKYETLENKYDKMNKDFKIKKKENVKLKHKNSEQKQKLKTLNDKMSAMRNELDENKQIKNEIKQLKEKLRKTQSECDRFKNKANTMQGQMFKEHNQKQTIQKQYKSLEEKYDTINKELNKRNKINLKYKDNKPPGVFECPISYEIMCDPVVASDGITYDRVSIQNWFVQEKKATSPHHGSEMKNQTVVTNYALKELIEKWKKKEIVSEIESETND